MEQQNVEVKAVERLQRLPYENFQTFELSADNTPWLAEILDEFCDYDKDHSDMVKKQLRFTAKLDIKRDINPRFKEYLLVKADTSLAYYTSCTRCLLPSYEKLKVSFAVCFLNDQFSKLEEYEEEDSLIIENEEYELYYYTKQNIPFKEFIREQVLMYLTPYSIHEKGCKGLCNQCGVNLNLESCKHNK